MKREEKDSRFGVLPTSAESAVSEGLYIHGFIRTDGKVTGYVLSNGLKVTREKGEEMLKSGEVFFLN